MSIKALARQALERNGARNLACNTPPTAATARATPDAPHATALPAADIEERAAIVEEGAKVPRAWAEGFARLEALPAPAGVDPRAWLDMMTAAGSFLDQWGSNAAALGWSSGELFGLDTDAPISRLDRRGAAYFLAGAQVVAITANEITFRKGGAVQCIRRQRAGLSPPDAAVWRG